MNFGCSFLHRPAFSCIQTVFFNSAFYQALVCWTWNHGIRSCDQAGAGSPTAHTELYSNPRGWYIENFHCTISLCPEVRILTCFEGVS